MDSRIDDSGTAELRLNFGELVILNNALNEICHGFEMDEFETRIGSSKEQARVLLREIGRVVDQLSQTGSVG